MTIVAPDLDQLTSHEPVGLATHTVEPAAQHPGIAPYGDTELSEKQLGELAAELDALRDELLADIGQRDADYIRRIVKVQKSLELGGRASLMAGVLPPMWVVGVAMLAASKILENMEIGHNVMHGQYDWMRDPHLHSSTYEWDNVCPSSQWKHYHNAVHHQWTNVRGLDDDLGYGVFRVDPTRKWSPAHAAQPLIFVALAALFQYGVGYQDSYAGRPEGQRADWAWRKPKLMETARKIRRQWLKDYVAFPALAAPLGAPSAVAVLSGNAAANLIRNVWSFSVIFCGHFPDGVAIFDKADAIDESRGHWYLRQITGSANFTGGRLMDIMSGNLNHQVEHHVFPDIPANRYAEVAPKLREICGRYGLRYNTGSMPKQFATVVKKICRLALPG
ncbi:MAG TPA: acyl-CoA desaturase [Microthrixaceae bacterium]|nr:acyl-CoA desaturase [Microthrixaceae bacterium]